MGRRRPAVVVFAIHEPGSICILASKPIPCGPGVERPAALGWYHSHIRSRTFLSERDLQIHSRYFDAPF
jgi:hypothetical protein